MKRLAELGLENKYVVIKYKDINELSDKYRTPLRDILRKIEDNRKANGKKQNEYIVINADELYVKEVVEIIKEHESVK